MQQPPNNLETVDRTRLEQTLAAVLAGFRPTRSDTDRRLRRLLLEAHRQSRRGDDLADLLDESWQRQASEPRTYAQTPLNGSLTGYGGLGLLRPADDL